MSETLPTKRTFDNLAGRRFGRLTVLEFAGRVGSAKKKVVAWKCQCDCGNVAVVRATSLKRFTRSCGCLRQELSIKHGQHNAPDYRIWKSIIQRCTNPRDKHWKCYGGRGIRVCQRWRQYVNFISDMGPRPSRKHSIDRIDNDGDYEPGNCRWVTPDVQARNTRRNRMLTVDGTTMCLADWADRSGINSQTIAGRLRSGWDVRRAVTEPSRAQLDQQQTKGEAKP